MGNLQSSKQDVISVIASKYCELLENFEDKWENPVIDFGAFNKFSKTNYRGFNALFLGLISSEKGCNRYGTFKQWTEAGYKIKQGTKGIPVFFWKSYKKSDKLETLHHQEPLEEEKEEKKQKEEVFLVARKYIVFNGADIEGYNQEDEKLPSDSFDTKEVERIEHFFNNIELSATIKRDALVTPYYSLKTDTINIPPTKNFKSIMELCSSFAHEFAHSTGHPNRLNRDLSGKFGSPKYAREELIAEISAGMVAGQLGYAYQFNKQILAYLKSWLKGIPEAKDKGKLLLSVCKEAQRSADWIIEHSNLRNN